MVHAHLMLVVFVNNIKSFLKYLAISSGEKQVSTVGILSLLTIKASREVQEL